MISFHKIPYWFLCISFGAIPLLGGEFSIGSPADGFADWHARTGSEVKNSAATAVFKPGTLAGRTCGRLDYSLAGRSNETYVSIGKTFKPVDGFRALLVELYCPDATELFVRFVDRTGKTFAYKYAVTPSANWQTVQFRFDNAIPGFPVFVWGGDGKHKDRIWHDGLRRVELCFPRAGSTGISSRARVAGFAKIKIRVSDAPHPAKNIPTSPQP